MNLMRSKKRVLYKLKIKEILIALIMFISAVIISKSLMQFKIISTIIVSTALSVAFYLILVYSVHKTITTRKKLLLYILFFALLLKILFMLIMHNVYLFPDELGVYDRFAWLKAQDWLGGEEFDLPGHSQVGPVTSYYYFLSIIYFLFGHDVIIAKLFNVFLSLAAGVLLFLLAKEIFDERIALISFVAFLFLPSINIYSFPLLRDGFMIFILTALFFFITKLMKKFNLLYLLFFIISFLLLAKVRKYVLVIFGIAGLIYCFFNIQDYRIGIPKIKSSMAPFLLLVIMVLLIFTSLDYSQKIYSDLSSERLPDFTPLGELPKQQAQKEDVTPTQDSKQPLQKEVITTEQTPKIIKKVDDQRRALVSGSMTFKEEMSFRSWRDFLNYLPSGAAYFILSPLLSLSTRGPFILLFTELFYFIILPFAVYGLILSTKKRPLSTLHLTLFILSLSMLYISVEANVGTLLRHRIQIVPFLILFFSYGFVNLLRKVKKRVGLYDK